MTLPMLSLRGIDTYYGAMHILRNISLEVCPGELVCLLGGNASGKSTTLKTILGLVKPANGSIDLNGEAIQHYSTSERIARGIAVVPENRRIFADMSVDENLQIGTPRHMDRVAIQRNRERVFTLFPLLKDRLRQIGGTLSGGEQQMLAMARALMSQPVLLLMDEPSMGLSPRLVEQNFELIRQVNAQGVTMLVVEQNAAMALSIAHRGYVLQTGEIVLADTANRLLNNTQLRKAYLT